MGAPSTPGWKAGYVPSAGEWNNTFGDKADYPVPAAQGGTGQTYTPEDNQILVGSGGQFALNTVVGADGVIVTFADDTVTFSASPVGAYPPAGIPQSTGTEWAGSYAVTGTGSHVVLSNNAILSLPTIADTLSFEAGSFSASLSGNPAATSNAAYVLPATYPPANGYYLSSTALGALSWAMPPAPYTSGTGITISGSTISLANTVVSPGSYALANVTFNAQGQATAASNAATTGSGNVVLANSPVLVTPNIGAATGASLAIASGQVTATPVNPTDLANKAYVDAVANGLSPKASVQHATTAALPTNTYSNGASGVGATLTAVATGALVVDSIAVAVGDRILVKNEAAGANNGIYSCTVAGATGVAYVLTRTADSNTQAELEGAFCFVEQGAVNIGSGWVNTNSGAITIGTTAIVYTQISGAGTYSAGTGLSLTGTQFSISATGVTAGTYALTSVTINAQGQVTAISGAANTAPNLVLAGPNSGSSSASPTFRALVGADMPSINDTFIYAVDYGVVADGVTANDTALYNAIQALNTQNSYTNPYFRTLILPAGDIRITQPWLLFSNWTAIGCRVMGAGALGTTILADFSFNYAAPQFTLSGGGGSGCVLYPVIDNGALTAVRIISGGSGYTSAPTATLVTYNSSGVSIGSGATVSLSVSGGAVTGASVSAGGSGYGATWAGDALVFRGSHIELYDVQIVSSATRQAAGFGGNSAYPYFCTNNGVRMEPFAGLGSTVIRNRVERCWITGQPGHGINARIQEQMLICDTEVYGCGADGLLIHCAGNPNLGINNSIVRYRATGNGCRGMTVIGQEISNYFDCAIYSNLQAGGCIAYATLSGGALTGANIANSGMNIAPGTAAVIHGGGGSGAAATPTISGGRVTGFTFTGGSGYTTSGYSAMYISVAGPGLPSGSGVLGVNEEVAFSGCYNQNARIDIESNTGSAVGRDLMSLLGCYSGTYGGCFRGGRYNINANSITRLTIDNATMNGNSSDVVGVGIFANGSTGTSAITTSIGIGQNVYQQSYVNIPFYAVEGAQPFAFQGNLNGVLYVAGLQSTPYTWTYATSITPNPGNQGWEQNIPLTGPVTINACTPGGSAISGEGSKMTLIFKQDATGGRVVTMTTTGVANSYVGANVGSIGSGTANQIGVLALTWRTRTSGTGYWFEDYWSGWY